MPAAVTVIGSLGVFLVVEHTTATKIVGAGLGCLTAVGIIVAIPGRSDSSEVKSTGVDVCGPSYGSYAEVKNGDDREVAPGVSLDSATYRYSVDDERYLHVAFKALITGQLQRGSVLVLVTTTDGVHVDSTPERRAPTKNFYVRNIISRDNKECMSFDSRTGYPGACGSTPRYLITLMSPATFDTFQEQRREDKSIRENGFTRDQLIDARVSVLQYFDVPTKPC